MTDYVRLSEVHEARGRFVAELLRTVAVGGLLVVLLSVMVFGGLACVSDTAATASTFQRPVTAAELDVVVHNLTDRIIEARR